MTIFLKNGFRSIFFAPKNRMPALDGLRALAILMVVFQHSLTDYLTFGAGVTETVWGYQILRGMWVGVDLFFVLSGFLIGGILLKQFEAGRLNFSAFWKRRILRVWPAYFFVLICAMAVFQIRPPEGYSEWPELLFYANYVDGGILSGSWTIATEEQFYLLAPIGIFLLLQFSKDIRKLRLILFALILLEPVIRYYTWTKLGSFPSTDKALLIQNIHLPLHTHADGLLIGFLLATMPRDNKRIFPILLLSTLLSFFLWRWNPVIFIYSMISFCFGALLWLAISEQRNPVSRFFSLPVFFPVAKLSFGIYLLHRFFSPTISGFLAPWHSVTLVFFGVLFCSFVCATALYVFIEKPFLDLR